MISYENILHNVPNDIDLLLYKVMIFSNNMVKLLTSQKDRLYSLKRVVSMFYVF
jgi:hypothetical protein